MRGVAMGSLGIALPIYLGELGVVTVIIGIFLAASNLSTAIMNGLSGTLGSRFGGKRLLIIVGILIALANIVYAVTTDVRIILLTAGLAVASASGSGAGAIWGGPVGAVHRAMLAGNVSDEGRNRIFGLNAFVATIAASGGALLVGLPDYLEVFGGMERSAAFSSYFLILATVGILASVSILPIRDSLIRGPKLPLKSRRLVGKLMAFNFSDGFAWALVFPLLSLWFHLRFSADLTSLAIVFAGANIVSAFAFLGSGYLADRVGAVKSLFSIRIVTALLTLGLALAPTFNIAVLILMIRIITAVMFAPIWQSYLMGIIPPDERAPSGAVTSLAWKASTTISPPTSGYLMQSLSLTLPFYFSAVIQLVTYTLFFTTFRNIKPPEEVKKSQ
jgi:MFS family permease